MAGNMLTLTGLLLLVSGGCTTCSNCYDYLPPVAGSSQDWGGERAGSRFVQPEDTQPGEPGEGDLPLFENGLIESHPASVLESWNYEETVSPFPGLDENS